MQLTERFKTCLPIVLGAEGGYVNHPNDNGKATNFGVTQVTYDKYRTGLFLKPRPVKEITLNEVHAIYHRYWVASNCDQFAEPLDLLIFDFAINSGPNQAVKTLQKVLGTVEDGIAGRNTIVAAASYALTNGINKLCADYLDRREAFFLTIVARDDKQKVFLKGWLVRLNKLRKEIGIVKKS